MIVISNTSYLILIGSKVYTNIVTKVLANSVVPRESKLNTCILNVTTIDSSRIGTVNSNLLTTNQPVLSSLLIPVEVYTQTVVDETSIETKVKLLRCLPSQVRVRYDICVSTSIRCTSNRCCHIRTELITTVTRLA